MLWEEFRSKFGSNAKAAKRLHDVWTKVDSEQASQVTVPSLATKIGDLRRGKLEWWSRRLELSRLLAEELGGDVEDLLGRASIPPGALVFREFPALPPLRFEEEPLRIDRRGWLRELVLDGLQRGAKLWITAGPGMGKSLVIRWLEVHAEEACAVGSVRTLADAATLFHADGPLVLEIDEADPATDGRDLQVLERRGAATIILAPHVRPGARPAGLLMRASPSGWKDHTVEFSGEARDRMLRWIDQRLERSHGDTWLDLDEVLEFLGRHDPKGRLVASPADLLAFCADVHVYGMDSESWESRARRWLRSNGPRLLPEDAPPSWTPLLATCYESLCAAAVARREHAWGPLPANAWSEMLPVEVCGPEKDRLGRGIITNNLRAAGLLRGAAGGLVLSPTWVRDGLTVALVERQIGETSPERWGLNAADYSRQHLVDEALDRRRDAAFCATVRAVTTSPRTLGQVAAVEAVYAAAARRLGRVEAAIPTPAELGGWHRLVELQIESMLSSDGVHLPYTRRGREGIAAFLANSWTLSLTLAPPESFDHDELAWHFPGWFDELVVPHPSHWPWSNLDDGELVARIVEQAFEVMPKVSEIPADSRLPRVLLPAAIVLAASRGWKLTQRTVADILGSWEERALIHVASQLSHAERAAIAALLWDVVPFTYGEVGPAPVTLRLARLKNVAPQLGPFILENLSEESLRRTIERDGVQHSEEVGDLVMFPRRLRRVVIHADLTDPRSTSQTWLRARALADILDEEDVELLIEILRECDADAAGELAGLVWRWSAQQAREEATRALEEGRPSARAWFRYAPRSELERLTAFLVHSPRPPEWVAEWARHRVLDGGPASEVLFTLSMR